jgi:hypothetical protein
MLDHLLNNTSLNKEQMFTLAGLMSKLLAKLPVDQDLTPEVLRVRGKVHDKLHAHLAGALTGAPARTHAGRRSSQHGVPTIELAPLSHSKTMRSPMTPTRGARSPRPLADQVIHELTPDQLFQKQLVSMGLNFNRRLADTDISVLHQLYPALQNSKGKASSGCFAD